jgi:hypothetical protein
VSLLRIEIEVKESDIASLEHTIVISKGEQVHEQSFFAEPKYAARFLAREVGSQIERLAR